MILGGRLILILLMLGTVNDNVMFVLLSAFGCFRQRMINIKKNILCMEYFIHALLLISVAKIKLSYFAN